MSTEKKMTANKANAEKSTGPRTDEGKEKSSRNSIKHGLFSQKVVITDGPLKEDPEEFRNILLNLVKDTRPRNSIESMLVDRLASTFWRLRRIYTLEKKELVKFQPEYEKEYAVAMSVQKFSLPEFPYEKIAKYEKAVSKEFYTALKKLTDQKGRK